jgi:type II secretory pathway pseudopilin PulG
MRPIPTCRRAARAFTLLEVVVAVGIFAVGMVTVIALFAPVARSVTDVADSGAAANIAGALGDWLQQRVAAAGSFAPVAPLLKVANGRGGHQLTDADDDPNASTSDPRLDPQILFASRDGTKVGPYTDAVWGASGAVDDREKFFEIALVRNETMSPNDASADATALVLTYTARIRWPAFVPDQTEANPRRALPAGFSAGASVRFDRSQQHVMFAAGAVKR